MNLSLQSAFLAEMSTLLILLAGAIVLYSSFREKYLVPWIAGWSVFTVSKVFLALSASSPQQPLWTTLGYSTYTIAVGLFAASVFFYVSHHKLLFPAVIALSAAFPLEIAYSLWRPSPGLHYAAFALCSVVGIMSSTQLARFAWGRASVGRWLLAAILVLLPVDPVGHVHHIVGTDLGVD